MKSSGMFAVMLLMGVIPPSSLSTPVHAQKASFPQAKLPVIGSLNHNRVGPSQAETASTLSDRQCDEAVARGETLFKAGDLSAAISSFQQGLSYAPDNGLAYQRLAEAQTAAGKISDAAGTYRTLLYHWPGKSWSNSQNGDPAVHMQFALVLLQLNQQKEALSVYQQGYKFLPTDRGPLPFLFSASTVAPTPLQAAVYAALGLTEYAGGNQDMNRAADYFQRALSLQPDLPQPYYYLGRIFQYKPSHGQEAVDNFARAAQLGGPEMKPFLSKALKDGTTEFDMAVKKSGLAAQ